MRGYFKRRNSRFGPVGILKERTNDSVIYVDLDRRSGLRLPRLWSTCRIIGLRPHTIRIDYTRRGWHLLLFFRERFHPAEIVALQTILGSDYRRERLNLMRVLGMRRTPVNAKFWRARWNILYAYKL